MTDQEAVIREERDPFANDVLDRLVRSNQDYQRGHGHYIVPLAERLLAERAKSAALVAERDAVNEAKEMWRNEARAVIATAQDFEQLRNEVLAKLEQAEAERDEEKAYSDEYARLWHRDAAALKWWKSHLGSRTDHLKTRAEQAEAERDAALDREIGTADDLEHQWERRKYWRARAEQAEARADALQEALDEYVSCADWYRRCLEDVQDRKVVRGLGEAKAGYDSALTKARTLADRGQE